MYNRQDDDGIWVVEECAEYQVVFLQVHWKDGHRLLNAASPAI